MCSINSVSLTDKDSKGRLFFQRMIADPDCGPDTVADTDDTELTKTDVICALTCALCQSAFV